MLTPKQTCKAYANMSLGIPEIWNLSRKHFRVLTFDGRMIKLNKFENRINERELRDYCFRFAPVNVYFSVLNWLFPERVGKKYKARYCVPLNGEYLVDIDSYLMYFKHEHKLSKEWNICELCLGMSKKLTLQVCEAIEKYYSKLAIVFSGRMGFHVHVMDFNYRDWTHYRENDPIRCHNASRFKFTKLLQKQTYVFNRAHFNVSVDPMRVVTVPNTINAKTGLVCNFLGSRKDFEKLSISEIISRSKVYGKFGSYPEPLESLRKMGVNGAMKSGAKNGVEST